MTPTRPNKVRVFRQPKVGAGGINGKPHATPLSHETLGDDCVPNRVLWGVSNTRENPPGEQAPKGLRQRRADYRKALADVTDAKDAFARIIAPQDKGPQTRFESVNIKPILA